MSGRPPIDLNQKIRELPSHTEPSPFLGTAPIRNYEQRMNAAELAVKYFDRHVSSSSVYAAVRDRHMSLLHRMTLVMFIEAFERFLKELAVACVDELGPFAIDDRFESFTASGSNIALQFDSASVGRALCESDTWLNNRLINERFRHVLKSRFAAQPWNEFVFPGENQPPKVERDRAASLAILWQIRHTITHNVGHLTAADARRFRLLIKSDVPSEQLLAPTRRDLHYVQRFLVETAETTNQRIGSRLAEVMTEFHAADNAIFEPQETAARLATVFQMPLTIAGVTATP